MIKFQGKPIGCSLNATQGGETIFTCKRSAEFMLLASWENPVLFLGPSSKELVIFHELICKEHTSTIYKVHRDLVVGGLYLFLIGVRNDHN